MMLLSCGGALALIGPALYFNGEALYPRTARDIGLVLIYGAVMQCMLLSRIQRHELQPYK